MDSTSVATVVFAFDEKNIENTYNGTGFVIARTSNTNITACTWTSKMAFTTPQGKVLIRAYVGKPGDTVVEDHTDDEIATIARRDLNKMMTFHGDPEFTIVNRLTKSMPQYHIGHIGQIRKIQQHVKIIILHSELQVHHLKRLGFQIVFNKVKCCGRIA